MQYIHEKLNKLKENFERGSKIHDEILHIQNSINGEFAKLRSLVD